MRQYDTAVPRQVVTPLLFALICVSALHCGGDSKKASDAGPQTTTDASVSDASPNSYLGAINLLNKPYHLNRSGEALSFVPQFVDGEFRPIPLSDIVLSMTVAPNAMSLDPDNHVTWTPATHGLYEATLHASYGTDEEDFDLEFYVYTPTEVASALVPAVAGGTVTLTAPGSIYAGATIEYPAGAFSEDTQVVVRVLQGPPQPAFAAIETTDANLLEIVPNHLPAGATIVLQAPTSPPDGFEAGDFVFTAWTSHLRAAAPLNTPPAVAPALLSDRAFTDTVLRVSNIAGAIVSSLYSPGYARAVRTRKGHFDFVSLLAPSATVDTTYLDSIFAALESAETHAESIGCNAFATPPASDPVILVGAYVPSYQGTGAHVINHVMTVEYQSSIFTRLALKKVIAHEYFHLLQFYMTPEVSPAVYNDMSWWAESGAVAFEDSLYTDNAYVPFYAPGGWSDSLTASGIGAVGGYASYQLVAFIQYLAAASSDTNVVCSLMSNNASQLRSGQLHDVLRTVLPKGLPESVLEFSVAYNVSQDASLIDDIGTISPTIDMKPLDYPSDAWDVDKGWKVNGLRGAVTRQVVMGLPADEFRPLVIKSSGGSWMAVVYDQAGNQMVPKDCVSQPCFLNQATAADDFPDLVGGTTYDITVSNATFPQGATASAAQQPISLEISLDEPYVVGIPGAYPSLIAYDGSGYSMAIPESYGAEVSPDSHFFSNMGDYDMYLEGARGYIAANVARGIPGNGNGDFVYFWDRDNYSSLPGYLSDGATFFMVYIRNGKFGIEFELENGDRNYMQNGGEFTFELRNLNDASLSHSFSISLPNSTISGSGNYTDQVFLIKNLTGAFFKNLGGYYNFQFIIE